MTEPRNSKHIEVIPLPYREIFSDFICFNYVQSQVLDDVLYSDKSIVLSAPTGSGKTVVFELGIVKLLMEMGNNSQDFKIVYISPIKSLCQERLVDWNRKFSNFGINCICVTGDSDNIDFRQLTNHNLIISTPEKWDSLTRNWRDNEMLVRIVKLFMIDEVHLLNEDDRGSTLEVIVSRMKTVKNCLPRNKNIDCRIRFMAVSATIGNIEDIAKWIEFAKFFHFPEEMRPVQLKTLVLGYNSQTPSSPFKFDLSLNYRLQNLIIQYSEGQPTLIFCSTRKSVEMTAKHLVQTLKIQINSAQTQKLQEASNSVSDIVIKQSVRHGVGIHHAGMSVENRHNIENVFREGHLPILVATSTLAMGVNLPAHLVIIKSTKCYSNGSYQDYSATAIHQMIGRAGRPQFDTHATALILTTNESKKKIEKQLNSTEPVESNLHKHLTEHLNAEVVLGTITGLDVAMQWLASTFLYIRARKNPRHYGLLQTLNQDQLDKKLLEIFQIDLNKLMRVGMVTMDEQINISPTRTGRLMARYYVDFETMKMFTEMSGTEVFIQILAIISKCQEFAEMRLRVNDKKTLNLLNRNSKKEGIRFPLNGKIKTWDMKVNCIIQAVLGNLELTDPALQTESFTILRNGKRIIQCLIDYLSMKKINCYSALFNSIIMGKCLRAKLWENSPFVSKQLSGIGSTYAAQLVTAGKTTFEKILQSNPRDIEVIIKRKPPFGNYLLDEVRGIPKYSVTLEKYHQGLKVTVTLENVDDLIKKCTLEPSCTMSLLVGNNFNEILIYERYQVSYTIENPEITKYIDLKSEKKLECVEAHFISEEWVGVDACCEVQFEHSNKCESPIVEKSPAKSYIQTFLDIYMKIKKPEKPKNTEKNSKTLIDAKKESKIKQSKVKQNQEKKKQSKNLDNEIENNKIKLLFDEHMRNKVEEVAEANESLKYLDTSQDKNESQEELSLPNNLSDSELIDILEDHKIITAYKNNNTEAECNEGGTEAKEEILSSTNDVPDYQDFLSSSSFIMQEDDTLVDCVIQENNEINVGADDKDDEKRKEKELIDKETNILQELQHEFNSENSIPIPESDTSADVIKPEVAELNISKEVKPNQPDFDYLTKTDPTLFLISQKYLTDVDSKDNVNTIHLAKSSRKNDTLRNLLNCRGKKKRKFDDIHPAEEFEDQIHREEENPRADLQKRNFFEKFKKKESKKIMNYDNIFSDEINNNPFKITEVLESPSQRRESKNTECYFENKKSLKWRTPLVFSPRTKFSPNINHKNGSQNAEGDMGNEGFNESFDSSLSSPIHSRKKFPKTPRRPRIKEKMDFKRFAASQGRKQGTKFPLSDQDYEQEKISNLRSSYDLEQISDLCSTELLSDIMKENIKSHTPRKTATEKLQKIGDYFSQITYLSQKSTKREKNKDINCSGGSNIDNKENLEEADNVQGEDHPLHQRNYSYNYSTQTVFEPAQEGKMFSPSRNRSVMHNYQNNNQQDSRSEYFDAPTEENYLVDTPGSGVSMPLAALPPAGEYIDCDDTGVYQNPACRALERSLPPITTSMHYSNYVEPTHFGYHHQGYPPQYVSPYCEYTSEVGPRSFPPPLEYMERETEPPTFDGPPPVPPPPHYTTDADDARFTSRYQEELSQQMVPNQNISQDQYNMRRGSGVIPINATTSACQLYLDGIKPDLNSSLVLRNPIYPPNYGVQPPLSCPLPYHPTYCAPAGCYPREHPHPYNRLPPRNTPYSHVDKYYVMTKYWNSLNTQP